MTDSCPIGIIGAGPAGLTAAYELARNQAAPLVLDKSDQVGGIARSEQYRGFIFDIGGHRFHTDVDEIRAMWKELLGPDLLRVPRTSHIYFNGRLIKYPLKVLDTLRNLGPLASAAAILSYLRAKISPPAEVANLEQWIIGRFGERIYRTFFKEYSEKVWGIPCDKIQADWAAQRIEGLSLWGAIANALWGKKTSSSLIDEFLYPRLGSGMMWEEMAGRVNTLGGEVALGQEVTGLEIHGDRVERVIINNGGQARTLKVGHLISSMPLPHLIKRITPAPPDTVQQAAASLGERSFILVGLITEAWDQEGAPWQWLYVHDPKLHVGRVQNYRAWSPHMIPDPAMSSMGMEYFCDQGDDLWNLSDAELVRLATAELDALWPGRGAEVRDGVVYRQPWAYPVYHLDYQEALATVQGYLGGIGNLQTIGRSGLHRYNNQDHSMLTGLDAAQRYLALHVEPSAGARPQIPDGTTSQAVA